MALSARCIKAGREPLLVRRAGSRDEPRRATLSSSLLCLSSASTFVAKVVACLADSWQRCSLALSANALSHAAARRCSLASSASAFFCAAARRCSLALPANPFSRAAARRRLLASSASAFSRVAASWQPCSAVYAVSANVAASCAIAFSATIAAVVAIS